jgi:D-alanyl-lipoteichoic acid acyltransferase DltB (MBOAT superfamily)
VASFGWETVVACAVASTLLVLCRDRLQGARKEWFLAAVSMLVLAKWQVVGLVVTLTLVGVAWLAMRQRATGKVGATGRVAGAVVALLVAALVFFKYTPWLATRFADLPSGIMSGWVVPFGLSFTVFRLIGVVQDNRALKAQIPGHRLVLLSLFFPTFPSGPITTVQSFRELGEEARFRSRVREGAARILLIPWSSSLGWNMESPGWSHTSL